ncbi:MAG: hypothetical protein CLLPBCKN_004499 [Chroococcidiopsis cubana SAG 39.79]|uniref:hypothetical protein n=1 Tax=Chroococcidiopsis cubana TaxID=171392 RepID=UPI002AC706BC|nr:hypothetical protein [Chroococcidiopsis cubana]MDZ4875103.1 hypothetical protein [Chroococcidiopsis cubana SAG 39.79]
MNLSVDRRNITKSHHGSKMILACDKKSGVGSRWGTRGDKGRQRGQSETRETKEAVTVTCYQLTIPLHTHTPTPSSH